VIAADQDADRPGGAECVPGPKLPGFGLPCSRRMPAHVPIALAAATDGR